MNTRRTLHFLIAFLFLSVGLLALGDPNTPSWVGLGFGAIAVLWVVLGFTRGRPN